MKRKKKLTIKFIPIESKTPNSYNLYCRVTYNRKTTKFSTYQSFSADSKEHANEMIQGVIKDNSPDPWVWKKEWIEGIINYEMFHSKGEYSIIGLGERMKDYQAYLLSYLIGKCFTKFAKLVEEKVTHKEYSEFEYIFGNGRFSGTTFLEFIEGIVMICNKKDIKISSFIDQNFFNCLLATGAFLAMQDVIQRKLIPDGMDPFSKECITLIGYDKIGDWVVNYYNKRTKFREYLIENEMAFVDRIDKYTNDNAFSKIIYSFELNHGNVSQIIITTIDSFIKELIKDNPVVHK